MIGLHLAHSGCRIWTIIYGPGGVMDAHSVGIVRNTTHFVGVSGPPFGPWNHETSGRDRVQNRS